MKIIHVSSVQLKKYALNGPCPTIVVRDEDNLEVENLYTKVKILGPSELCEYVGIKGVTVVVRTDSPLECTP